jgi:integrase
VGERKIAGRRHLSTPLSLLYQLRLYFDDYRLTEITAGEVRKFKVWLANIPARSQIKEEDNGLKLIAKEDGGQRGIESINRALELLRTILNFAVEEKLLQPEHNLFIAARGRKLIDWAAENQREHFPTFGEELALLNFCNIKGQLGNAHLRPILIVAADTGLRRNELLTLTDTDLDFNRELIRVRAINAKTNRPRQIPMTPRVKVELQKLVEKNGAGLVFGGLKNVKRSYATACRKCGIEDLNRHDFRHGFVSRAILAGIPPAVALSASGHASDEWKRYLNMMPDQLQYLLEPLEGQDAQAVRTFAEEVMRGLRYALKYDQVEKLFMVPQTGRERRG